MKYLKWYNNCVNCHITLFKTVLNRKVTEPMMQTSSNMRQVQNWSQSKSVFNRKSDILSLFLIQHQYETISSSSTCPTTPLNTHSSGSQRAIEHPAGILCGKSTHSEREFTLVQIKQGWHCPWQTWAPFLICWHVRIKVNLLILESGPNPV